MAIKTGLSDKTRNELCPCKSGLKQKHCHGDPKKLQACNQIARLYMMKLIREERKKRGIDPYVFICEKCGKGTDQPRPSKLAKNVLLCPNEDCGGTVKVNEKPKLEDKQEDCECDSSGGILIKCPEHDLLQRAKREEQEKKNSIILEN